MVNLCNKGEQQSPVNILTDKVLECSSDQCHLTFYYKPSDVCDMQNINDKIIINYPKGSYVIYNLDIDVSKEFLGVSAIRQFLRKKLKSNHRSRQRCIPLNTGRIQHMHWQLR